MTDAEVLHELYRSVIMLAAVVALWAVLTTVLHFQLRSLRRTVRALVALRVTDDGICGDEAPFAVGPGAVMVCDLPYGHASEWHSGERDGRPPMRWRNRGLSGA